MKCCGNAQIQAGQLMGFLCSAALGLRMAALHERSCACEIPCCTLHGGDRACAYAPCRLMPIRVNVDEGGVRGEIGI